MEGGPIGPLRTGARFESWIYRACGVDLTAEMGWLKYALSLLVFNGLGGLAVYALQRLELWLH
jgi:potassium-transporting ATPase potassium-binding subunit